MKKLTVQDIPLECTYAAIDSEGRMHAFDTKPILKNGKWHPTGRLQITKPGNALFDSENWENSLIEYTVNGKDLNKRQKFLLKYYDLLFPHLEELLMDVEPEDILEYEDGDYVYQAICQDCKVLSIENIPDGYKWAAVNRDGSGVAFKTKPYIGYCSWDVDGDFQSDSNLELQLGKFDPTNWMHSLISIND